ncbi:hypothetical protein ACFE04_022715 [Oxalis oulophora]
MEPRGDHGDIPTRPSKLARSSSSNSQQQHHPWFSTAQQRQYSPAPVPEPTNPPPPPPPKQKAHMIREQDQYMPIANVIRIMRRILPPHAKVSDDAKETMQECVSEFISFITGEANDRCQREQRKTITAEDILWAMGKLGFDDYIEPLTMFLNKFREIEPQRSSLRGEPMPKRAAEYVPVPATPMPLNYPINGMPYMPVYPLPAANNQMDAGMDHAAMLNYFNGVMPGGVAGNGGMHGGLAGNGGIHGGLAGSGGMHGGLAGNGGLHGGLAGNGVLHGGLAGNGGIHGGLAGNGGMHGGLAGNGGIHGGVTVNGGMDGVAINCGVHGALANNGGDGSSGGAGSSSGGGGYNYGPFSHYK